MDYDFNTSTIYKYSHSVVVKNPTKAMIPVLYGLSSRYTQFGVQFDPRTKKKRWGPLKTYAVYVDHGAEFRFHIGQYDELMMDLERRVHPSSYKVIEVPLYEPEDIDLRVRDGWSLYPQQEEARNFIVDADSSNRSPLLMMPMGTGKTLTAVVAAAALKKRIAVMVIAQYCEKWQSDLQEILDLDKSEICVIQGSDSLMRATNYPGSGLEFPKAFVISLNTMNRWYSLYEQSKQNPLLEAYACMPYDFYEHLGIGTVINDEVHQHPHAVYRAYTYTHVPKTISLSATLLTTDQVLQRVQGMMFPRFVRYDNIKMKQYITVHACSYQIVDFAQSKVQTTEWGQKTYSHTAFEKSIMRNKLLLRRYVDMILNLAEDAWYNIKIDGDKLLVYVATKKLAEIVKDAALQRWPHLDCRTFLQGDSDANMKEPDIRVTTVISGSTAHDVPGLRVTIMTNSIDSPNSNVQALGRLREIKHRDHDTDVHFYYLYCSSIPKHVEYHRNKVELLKSRAKEQKERLLGGLFYN